MKKIILLFLSLLLSIYLNSCVTRTETDLYTISDLDTTYVYHVRNAPENEDRGVVFPSSKVVEYQRNLIQHDSIVERYYPDFIRFGLFEAVGTYGGDADYSIGTGLLGVFPDFGKLDENFRGDEGKFGTGGIYRLGIIEKRIRWFRDSPNWTIGTHGIELIMPDARLEKSLLSIAPLYLRKRWYLSEKIPYLSIAATFGLGYFPSQYINLSGSLELGSIGGLNLRAYIGAATGVNMETSTLIQKSDYANSAVANTIPYAGLGVSVLDFHNIVAETEREWKDHEHSSWEVGLLQLGFMTSTSENSAFANNSDSVDIPFFKGWFLRVANSKIALPLFDYKLYAGTSLLNIFVLGQNEWGFSVLPIRLGYWQTLVEDELTVEPFLELSYYPTYYFQLGSRVNLRIREMFNLSLEGGYINGGNNNDTDLFLQNSYGLNSKYSKFYFGIVLNMADRLFYPQHLRYNKK